MEITLTPEIERALKKEALKQGTTPELLAIDALRKRFVPSTVEDVSPRAEGTLAGFLEDHIGVLSSNEYIPGGAAMSEESGKKFTAGLVLTKAKALRESIKGRTGELNVTELLEESRRSHP